MLFFLSNGDPIPLMCQSRTYSSQNDVSIKKWSIFSGNATKTVVFSTTSSSGSGERRDRRLLIFFGSIFFGAVNSSGMSRSMRSCMSVLATVITTPPRLVEDGQLLIMMRLMIICSFSTLTMSPRDSWAWGRIAP